MREIKFRAWNKTSKQWFMEGAVFDLKYSGRYGDFYFDNDHPCNMRQVDLEWMQFTGLLDGRGKEIYEGDVVRTSISFEGVTLPHIGEVVYCAEYASFATRNDSGNTLFHNHGGNTREVIGNIYEV